MSVVNVILSNEKPKFEERSHPVKPARINTTKPVPTNTFWTNLILKNGNNPIYINPYLVWYNGTGFNINYSDLTVTKDFIITNRVINFSIGTSKTNTFTVTRWDSLSVDVQLGNLTYYFVRGSPFLTCRYNNDMPVFKTQHAVLSVTATDANKYVVKLNNNQTWIIYHEGGLTLSNTLEATSAYTGILRTMLIPAGSQVNVDLNKYAALYPTGGSINYTLDNGTANLTYTFSTGRMNVPYSDNNLLMYTLPHHQKMLSSPSNITGSGLPTYRTIKGLMLPYVGTTWAFKLTLTDIDFNSRLAIDSQYVKDVTDSLQSDSNIKPINSDPYFFGKEIAKLARLLIIADELKQDEIKNKLLTSIKVYLLPWLTNQNTNRFIYDNAWKGVVSLNGIQSESADFGNGWYNDHHFHYGYFFYAFSVVIKFDSSFYATYKNQILSLVRDVANPSVNDPYFPVTRNIDWFDGHSWANGIVEFGDSKNQESTSEAVNCYYSLYLLGLSVKDDTLTNLGRVMMDVEILSSQTYWQIKDETIYPKPFSDNRVVGIVWSTKVDYSTWFGKNVEFIHGIQMLPFTPISEKLLDPVWIKLQQPILETALTRSTPPLEDGWRGYIYMSKAIIDPTAAYNWIKSFRGGFDGGNTRTNTLYWILTRPGLGIARSTNPDPNPDPNPNPNPNPDPTVLIIDQNSPITKIILNRPCTITF